MEKTIYHGSDHIIEKPKFGYGKPYNDYGIGFYCTQNPNMAKEWGVASTTMATLTGIKSNATV